MKKILILLFGFLTIISCKKKEAENADLVEIEAEFIYIQDAAVLKGKSFIYGVVLDDMATKLSKKVAPMKKDKYDMVPVIVNGVVKQNPEKDGWKEVVEIKEILKVLPVKKENLSETIKVNVE